MNIFRFKHSNRISATTPNPMGTNIIKLPTRLAWLPKRNSPWLPKHSDQIVQGMDEHRQPQVVGLGIEEAKHQPRNVAKYHAGSIQMGQAEQHADTTMENPMPYLRSAERITPRKANSSIKGTSTAVTAISSKMASRDSPWERILPGDSYPKLPKKLLHQQSRVIAQQHHAQTSHHTKQPTGKSQPSQTSSSRKGLFFRKNK